MTPRGVVLLSVVLAVAWQWALVHFAYGGNWTAVFCAGDQFSRPSNIQQREYLFSGAGYDGQFYQLIAHDPVFVRQYDSFVDAPRLRYRRILLPGLAFVLAGGNQSAIDWTYIAVYWSFIALGTWSLASLAVAADRAALWGILFLLAPATLVGLERMTVDTALAALSLSSILAACARRWVLLWLSLAGAMLAKETGVLMIAAVVFWLAGQRKYRLAALFGASLLPAAAWYVFVQAHTARDFSLAGFSFLTAYFVSMKTPINPGFLPMVFRAATLAAVVALLWMALWGVALGVRSRFREIAPLVCFVYSALVLLLQTGAIWAEPNGFARIYSPLMVCMIAAAWRQGLTLTIVLFALVTCPVAMQLGVHLGAPLLRPWLR